MKIVDRLSKLLLSMIVLLWILIICYQWNAMDAEVSKKIADTYGVNVLSISSYSRCSSPEINSDFGITIHLVKPEYPELISVSKPISMVCQYVESLRWYMEMSESDMYELATLVYLESGIESYECQKAVASVIINRMNLREETLQQVIYDEYQFSPAHKISSSSPSQSCINSVYEVLKNGPTIPEYVCYFRSGYYFNWGDRYIDYTKIDHTYFTYDKADKAKWEELQ